MITIFQISAKIFVFGPPDHAVRSFCIEPFLRYDKNRADLFLLAGAEADFAPWSPDSNQVPLKGMNFFHNPF